MNGPVPWPARIRYALGEWIRSRLGPSPSDVARAMADQRILSIRATTERIEIIPTEAKYRANPALIAIVSAVSHLWESGVTYRPYSERERRRSRAYGYEMIGKGHPVWSVPIIYERRHPCQDVAAFDALAETLGAFDRPVSLPELKAASEKAYLDTRPADFNFHHYYA